MYGPPHLVHLTSTSLPINATIHLESHTLLDLSNGLRRVETLGACPRAVQDGVASVKAHAVIQHLLPFGCALIT